jgi:hypothetical protein
MGFNQATLGVAADNEIVDATIEKMRSAIATAKKSASDLATRLRRTCAGVTYHVTSAM